MVGQNRLSVLFCIKAVSIPGRESFLLSARSKPVEELTVDPVIIPPQSNKRTVVSVKKIHTDIQIQAPGQLVIAPQFVIPGIVPEIQVHMVIHVKRWVDPQQQVE
jgi:hypothetical protein